ncbi:ShlB/FhaC/HecB family hemolysin secretion/activation protein [uncultured Erythrobacter sp.]|uniref:ShlB/FhaC/HecB family hemolysin secretion/activation protein n=1 Tax=uncultured Erythrobacter sp. TaxID=263913 RepID=UPI002608192A|nr:ShlB/FhaC/HecB family hemolysin secretion/activation protein [uncultured Erythrobacter sp.]
MVSKTSCTAGGLAVALSPIFFITATQASAQAVVPTREELQGIARGEDAPPPRLTVEGGIERSPCALADPQYADVRLTIRSVNFNGLKGATPQELEPAWKPFEGQEHPVAILCEIRDAAATILRNKGYLAATQVPTQRIEDGNVTFEVLYGRITAVRARGETRGAEGKLQQYLGRLSESEIFDRNEAERYLLLARDLPGYNVNLTLRPAGGDPGNLIGEVTVRRQRSEFDLAIQNYGAEATGPFGGQVRARFYGLTGMGDATTLSYFASSDFDEQHVVQASHEFRPGGDGLIVGGQVTYAWTRPDLGLAAAANVAVTDLTAETLFANISASYPVKRTQAESIYVSAGFDYINQDVDFIAPLSRDRIRVGWVKLDYDAIDVDRRAPRYRANGTIEYRQGLDVFGASNVCFGPTCPAGFINPGRLDGEPTGSVIRASGVAEFSLSSLIALTLKPRAQLSLGGGLFGFEEFAAGNFTVGRGYDPGTIIGDSGVALATELRTATLPLNQSGRLSIQPYAFFDLAKVWNEAPEIDDDLYSVGAGARTFLGGRYGLDVNVSVPLKRAGLQTERGDVRVLFTLTASI